jgi:hypothetical protein
VHPASIHAIFLEALGKRVIPYANGQSEIGNKFLSVFFYPFACHCLRVGENNPHGCYTPLEFLFRVGSKLNVTGKLVEADGGVGKQMLEE